MVLARRWKRIVFLLILLWLIVAAIFVALGAVDAHRGIDSLKSIQSRATTESIKSGDIDNQLRQASTLLTRAHKRLHNPALRALHWVPVGGRQLTSADDLTGAGAKVAQTSLDALLDARPLATDANTDRAGTLAKLGTIADTANKRLTGLDLGPKKGLLSILAKGRNEISSDLARVQNGLSKGAAGAEGAAALFSDNGRYLVMAGNNAEMRAGSGMFLSAGTMTTGGGHVDLGTLDTVGNLKAPAGSAPWPADISKNWGFLGDESDLRNLMLSPRFDASAPLPAPLWEAAGKGNVNGVMVIDPDMLQAVLTATGPVDVNGTSVTSGNVIQTLLIDQYKALSQSKSAATQAERRQGLSDVATAVFKQLNAGSWDPITLAKALGGAADGRHIMLWSSDPTQNSRWQTAHVGGNLTADSTMLSLVNLGANKIDQFLQTSAAVTTQDEGGKTVYSVAVTVKNATPSGLPSYVVGPSPGLGLVAGEYSGVMEFNLPAHATQVGFTGGDQKLLLQGADGPTQAIGASLQITAGQTKTFTLAFSVPQTVSTIVVEPSARIPATKWSAGGANWTDDHQHLIG